MDLGKRKGKEREGWRGRSRRGRGKELEEGIRVR